MFKLFDFSTISSHFSIQSRNFLSSILSPISVSLYYYNNLPRLCYWWSNPNDAAVAIGMFLPFVWILTWYIEKEKLPIGVKYASWIIECAALMLLLSTYSRWAIISGVCAIIVFGLVAREGSRDIPACEKSSQARTTSLRGGMSVLPWLKSLQNTWLRIFVILVALITTNAWGRFLTAIQGDKSVLNRLDLWIGGLKMIVASPFTGWGGGSAGVSYDNWYQNLTMQTFHGTLVNSYLNIAVECGLPVFWIILLVLLVNIFLCYCLARSVPPAHKGLLAGAAAILVYFTLVNVGYSTIYYTLPIVVLSVAVLIVAGFCIRFGSPIALLKSLLFSLIASVVCILSLYLGCIYVIRNESIHIKRITAENILLIKSRNLQKIINLTIVPDYRILGPSYGRLIRQALDQDANYSGIIQVLEPEATFDNCAAENIIVLGARINDWGSRDVRAGQRLIFVCPTSPPAGQLKIQKLFLPLIDRWHVAEAWKDWAKTNGCPISYITGDGLLDEANLKEIWDYCNAL